MKKLIKVAEKVHDPRRQWGNLRHKLPDILVIAFCAILCGAQTYDDLELFGKAKKDWLSWFLELRNPTPSADTFARIFQLIDPKTFAKSLRNVLKSEELYGKIIAFDGKTMRGSGYDGQRAFQMLTAFLVDGQIVIGEEAIDNKSNEITAIPELLDQINVKGTTVTIDAIGTQANIAEKIIEKEADYALALKKNHPDLYQDVKLYFDNESISQTKVTKNRSGGAKKLENIRWKRTLIGCTIVKSGLRFRPLARCAQLWKQRTKNSKKHAILSLLCVMSNNLLMLSEPTGGLKTACIGTLT